MPRLDPFIRHAITPPAFDEAKLHRERLVDALHANIPKKLIVIAAPPGYGKTTLLADFHHHTEIPTCWVRLTEADVDVMRLASLLRLSLERRFRRLRARLNLDALASASPAALARSFATAIETHVSEAFAILMDDVHLVQKSRPVLEFLDEFLACQPGQVTLIAAGREVLDISVAQLMAEGNLAGLGPQDLALTAAELAEVSRLQLGVTLDAAGVESLLEETRGWITGVLLSRTLGDDLLRGIRDTSTPLVYDYLSAVVLNRQPDDVRHFLMDSSLLPVMTAESCDAVLGRHDSGRMLGRLLRSGLFLLSAGAGSGTFEFHPQFREFLLATMEARDPVRLKLLRKRAAEWLDESGQVEAAVRLYFEAGLPRRAAVLAERSSWPMRRAGRFATLEEWTRRCLQAGCQTPWLIFEFASACGDHGQFERGVQLMDEHLLGRGITLPNRIRLRANTSKGMMLYQAGRLKEVRSALEQARAAMTRRVRGRDRAELLRLEAMVLAADRQWEQAETLILKALSLLEEATDPYNLAFALIDLSHYQLERGDKAGVVRSMARALPILSSFGAPAPLGVAYTNLAGARYLLGEFDRALEAYSGALKNARLGNAEYLEAMVLLGEADLFSDLGLAFQAGELYGAGLALASQIDRPDLIAYGCLQTAMLHRRSGTPAVASEWLKRATAALGRTEASAAHSLELAALEIRVSPMRSVRRLRRLIESSHGLTAFDRARALYWCARGTQAAGDESAARDAYEACLDWIASSGTEQAVAPELRVDPEAGRVLGSSFASHPAAGRLLDRVRLMEAYARQYDPEAKARSAEALVEFLALGQSTIRVAGKPPDGLKPMAREVAFYLLDAGPVERDVLVETFWPEHSLGRQTANLHMAIYQLRQLLGKDSVTLSGSAYVLQSSAAIEYDVRRFERSAAIAERLPVGDPRRMFALTEAVNSYGGIFLPESDAAWVMLRRRQLQSRYIDLLEAGAEESMTRDQVAHAAQLLQEAVEHEPLRDDLHEQLMRALHRLGRRSEIVELYQRYVRALSEDLGLDPPDRLRELYTRLIS
jgi:ATP/maltotriose-dependent transcriptional regulator MalT/DNA-binding SARP family transcriptional activator